MVSSTKGWKWENLPRGDLQKIFNNKCGISTREDLPAGGPHGLGSARHKEVLGAKPLGGGGARGKQVFANEHRSVSTFYSGSGNTGPAERQSLVCSNLVRPLIFHREWQPGYLFPLLEEKWPELETDNEMASEQSQPHGILGEQDLRPSTHCVTLQGRAA